MVAKDNPDLYRRYREIKDSPPPHDAYADPPKPRPRSTGSESALPYDDTSGNTVIAFPCPTPRRAARGQTWDPRCTAPRCRPRTSQVAVARALVVAQRERGAARSVQADDPGLIVLAGHGVDPIPQRVRDPVRGFVRHPIWLTLARVALRDVTVPAGTVRRDDLGSPIVAPDRAVVVPAGQCRTSTAGTYSPAQITRSPGRSSQ